MVLMDVYPGDVYRGTKPTPAGQEPKAFVWGVADDGRLLMSEMYDNGNVPARFVLPADRAGWRRIDTNDLARRKGGPWPLAMRR